MVGYGWLVLSGIIGLIFAFVAFASAGGDEDAKYLKGAGVGAFVSALLILFLASMVILQTMGPH